MKLHLFFALLCLCPNLLIICPTGTPELCSPSALHVRCVGLVVSSVISSDSILVDPTLWALTPVILQRRTKNIHEITNKFGVFTLRLLWSHNISSVDKELASPTVTCHYKSNTNITAAEGFHTWVHINVFIVGSTYKCYHVGVLEALVRKFVCNFFCLKHYWVFENILCCLILNKVWGGVGISMGVDGLCVLTLFSACPTRDIVIKCNIATSLKPIVGLSIF